ncbi:MAG: 4-hydroxy-tetrahydrodipicolinate synthase, partial [Campylobacterales bacterium]|nr:4-hydroxy-tetrahydrodipicolinate synthase [Campylobacterales bacterium]
MKNIVIGAMTALITPFKNKKIDEAMYAKLIQRQIDNGIDVVVPVGTTGESATLSHDEHKRCIEIAADVCKNTNVKVLAGAGSNCTEEAIDLATFAQKAGANAVLSVTPYYNKPTQEGLYQHYKALANSVEIPLMLYNVPGRTGVDLKPKTVERLFKDCSNIYGIKEATGSMERVVDLNKKTPDLIIVSGDDAINYPILANGGKGVISVTSNLLPNYISELVHSALNKNYDKAKELNTT